ncbi:MAG: DUF3017 domain-containing protein [Actinobacteria bacterium]|nr:DUF3017 domain-containing protein [Actinomycetota bacterium]
MSNVVQMPRKRRTPAILPLASVVIAACVSLGLLIVSFRIGALGLAMSVALALGFRTLLSDEAAGLLRVRSRPVDLCVLGALTALLLLLAIIVPDPS